MSTMPLPPDYSPDSDDGYRYGEYVPPTAEELAEIEAEIDALEGDPFALLPALVGVEWEAEHA